MKNHPVSKTKNRREGGGFSQIPWVVMDSTNWTQLSGTSIKLLLDLYRQYKGSNNGDLCASLKTLKPRGWTRGQTISNAIRELVYYGMIELTRQGSLHRASLFAVTWRSIDHCKGKLDVNPTSVASGQYKHTKPPYTAELKKRQAVKRFNAKPQNVLADERPVAH